MILDSDLRTVSVSPLIPTVMAFCFLVPEVEMAYGSRQTLESPGQRLQASPMRVILLLMWFPNKKC